MLVLRASYRRDMRKVKGICAAGPGGATRTYQPAFRKVLGAQQRAR